MTIRYRRTVPAVALAAAGLLLSACSSGAPTQTTAPAIHPDASAPSSAAPTAGGAESPAGATPSTARPSAAPHLAAAGTAACSLITEKDVTEAVGADPGKGSADSSHGATLCAYGSYPGQVLTVNVLPAQGRAAYDRARRDPHLGAAAGLRVADVDGLGDEAFELTGPHTDAIYLCAGDALVVVGLTAPTTSPATGAALILARIAADRL